MTDQAPINWGIIGTGNIARTFAKALQHSQQNNLVAIGSRSAKSAQKFAEQFALDPAHCHSSYDNLLGNQAVDAVYIATPHSDHTRWVMAALHQKLPVLCEKPMGLNHAEVMSMVHAATVNETFLMEGFMYRLHPQTIAVLEAIKDGVIGEVRHIDAQFGYHAPFNEDSRLFARALAGGGIMDVGCYPLSLANWVFAQTPSQITGHGYVGNSQVDEWASALLSYDNGGSAQISTSISLTLKNHAIIYGSLGRIELQRPWLPDNNQENAELKENQSGTSTWSFNIILDSGDEQTISGQSKPLFVIEADHVADCLHRKLQESPLITHRDSLNLALGLDSWRKAVDVRYPGEFDDNNTTSIWQLGATLSTPKVIPSGEINHLQKNVSRLVMGCDNQPSLHHAATMWDDFYLQGGNTFDTAYIYGQGSMEAMLGQWHEQRNIRNDIVIVGKGAHTPDNYPNKITPQLDVSLDRLRSDYVDMYFLHRDNLDIPVGEFIDALNDEVKRGRIQAFGGSNWTIARVREANQYAAENGLQGFSAVSNNFSLAQMVNRIWPGVEAVSSTQDLNYMAENDIALMPWSSQARGFFTPWAAAVMAQSSKENQVVTTMQPTVEELKFTWFSEENFARRERAAKLADKYQVDLINIALAYVLNQPFATFPLVGPRQLWETSSCISALSIALTSAEVAYLANGD